MIIKHEGNYHINFWSVILKRMCEPCVLPLNTYSLFPLNKCVSIQVSKIEWKVSFPFLVRLKPGGFPRTWHTVTMVAYMYAAAELSWYTCTVRAQLGRARQALAQPPVIGLATDGLGLSTGRLGCISVLKRGSITSERT